MSRHVVNALPWGDVDVDTQLGSIFFLQKWIYEWALWPGVTQSWTYAEKLAFHTKVDASIWRSWSNRVTMGVTGKSDLAKRFATTGMSINFDVKWHLGAGSHWRSKAWKMLPSATATSPHRSFVRFATREVEMNSADVLPRGAGNAAGASSSNFHTPPHEFGHMIGAPDEYNAGHPNLGDTTSMMNIGRAIRGRHMAKLIVELNGMFPDTRFFVQAVK